MSAKVSPLLPLRFKQAAESWEFEAIARLNYKTFVEEIPQHSQNDQQQLIDRFHEHNTYFICLRGRSLIGMITVRDTRPFSLDYKLGNLDAFLPEHHGLCEVRLLAVDREYRNGTVFRGLAALLLRAVHLKRAG